MPMHLTIRFIDPDGMMPTDPNDPSPSNIAQQYFDGFNQFARESFTYFKSLLGLEAKAEIHSNTETTVAKADVGNGTVKSSVVEESKIEVSLDLSNVLNTVFHDNNFGVHKESIISVEASNTTKSKDKLSIKNAGVEVSTSTSTDLNSQASSTTVEVARKIGTDDANAKVFGAVSTNSNGETNIKFGAATNASIPVDERTKINVGASVLIQNN